MQKKLLVTVSGNDFTDFDIMKALMSIGLNVTVEAAPSEAAQQSFAPDGLLDCANCDNRQIGSGFAECPNCGTARR